MATNPRQTLASTAFTAVTSVGTDGYIQNVGTCSIYLTFAAGLPSASSVDAHILRPNEGFQVIGGVPATNAYARCVDSGKTGYVISSS